MENNILQENFKKLNTVDNIKIFNDLEILVIKKTSLITTYERTRDIA